MKVWKKKRFIVSYSKVCGKKSTVAEAILATLLKYKLFYFFFNVRINMEKLKKKIH